MPIIPMQRAAFWSPPQYAKVEINNLSIKKKKKKACTIDLGDDFFFFSRPIKKPLLQMLGIWGPFLPSRRPMLPPAAWPGGIDSSISASAMPVTAPHPSGGGVAASCLFPNLDLILTALPWEEALLLSLAPPHQVGCLCPGTCLREAPLHSNWLGQFHKLDYYTV